LLKSRALLAMVTLACGLTASTARAQTCPAPADAPLVASIDAQQRLDYLAHAFDEEVRTTDLWSWTLGSAYTIGAVAQASQIPFYANEPGTRTDLYVGSVAFGVGALSNYLLPLQLTLPLRDDRRHWKDGDRCAVLARAEATLVTVQKRQAFATGPSTHIVNIVANVGIMLILGLGYNRWETGVISAVVGGALGEGNAFTQPSNLRDVLARYRSGQLDAPTAPTSKLAWGVVPTVSATSGGASFALSW
jgi:hypothetical protein